MLDAVRRFIPLKVKRALKRRVEKRKARALFGPLAGMVPPSELMFDGPGTLEEFKRNGEEFLDIYRSVCGLKPDERILDVGSGIGRKTIPLTQYLGADGSYDGIDVNPLGVQWCREHITVDFPAFRFQQVDARNALYNPHGVVRARDYRFPFEDGSFTFVTAQSVFTHMLPDEVEHYLAEIARVLSAGRCIASFFLLNDESRRRIAEGASSQPFSKEEDGWATTTPEVPETAIAIDETIVRAFFARARLEVVGLYPGSWCGRTNTSSYQDLVLAAKLS